MWIVNILYFLILFVILEYNVLDLLNFNMLGFYYNCLYYLECVIVGID